MNLLDKATTTTTIDSLFENPIKRKLREDGFKFLAEVCAKDGGLVIRQNLISRTESLLGIHFNDIRIIDMAEVNPIYKNKMVYQIYVRRESYYKRY